VAYRVYNTQALVIDSWCYGEASRRFYIYTKQLGRALARAKSVRKVSAKLQAGLQVGAESETELICGHSGWRVVGVTPQRQHLLDVNTGTRKRTAQLFNLFVRLIPKRRKNERIFRVISSGLKHAAQTKQPVIHQMMVYYLLAELGYGDAHVTAEIRARDDAKLFSESAVERFSSVRQKAVGHINRTLRQMQW